MSFFQVSSNDLHSSSDRLMQLNQKLSSSKESLVSNEQSLSLMWEGEAKEGFHQAFIRDMGQMDAFINLIDNYVTVMESIASRYDATEAKNVGIASSRTY